MEYKKLYDTLYNMGYHITDLTNIGKTLVSYIVENYKFNSILDIGCSQGLAVKEYQSFGKDAYGVDVSDVAIKKSKELNIINCFQSSVTELPFEDNKFDAVVSSDVLEHLIPEDINKAINEILRVSKKYLFMRISTGAEGNRMWIDALKNKYNEYSNIENLHMSIFTKREWCDFFTKTKKLKFIGSYKKIMIFEKI